MQGVNVEPSMIQIDQIFNSSRPFMLLHTSILFIAIQTILYILPNRVDNSLPLFCANKRCRPKRLNVTLISWGKELKLWNTIGILNARVLSRRNYCEKAAVSITKLCQFIGQNRSKKYINLSSWNWLSQMIDFLFLQVLLKVSSL